MWPFIGIFVPGILIIIKTLQDIDMGATHVIFYRKQISCLMSYM